MKTCLKCCTPKDESDFGKDSRKPDGKRPYCRPCARTLTAKYRESEEYRERERQITRLYHASNQEKEREYRLQREAIPEVKEKIRESTRLWFKRSPERKLLYGARDRAKRYNIPFDLTIDDIIIPDICPILDIKLENNLEYAGDSSPSLDRIKPELGYIKGNVAIISHRANTIKNDATVDELRKTADWLEKVTQKAPSLPDVNLTLTS